MRLIILTLACQGLLISDRCHMRFATLVDKKRGVRDDIKYKWTNLKIVRLGITRTHGWVELVPTVPVSSSHRSSTVFYYLKKWDFSSKRYDFCQNHFFVKLQYLEQWPLSAHVYTLKDAGVFWYGHGGFKKGLWFSGSYSPLLLKKLRHYNKQNTSLVFLLFVKTVNKKWS